MARQPDVAHGEREEGRPREDEGDHAVKARGAHEALGEHLAAHRSLHPGQEEGAHHAERRRLGGGGDAHVDRAQHERDERDRPDEVARGRDLLRERHRRVRRRDAPGVRERPGHGVAHEEAREEQPRQHARDEELGDRHLRRDPVDDHDDRGRDEQAQRARARERADRHVLGVAAAPELRQRHLADGGAGGRARARHGREDRAADDVGVQQPAGNALQPGGEALEHVLRQARAEEDLAHPQEERQRGEGPRRARAPDRDGHGVAHGAAREELHADPRDAQQGEPDPEPARQEREEEGDEDGGDEDVHRATPCASFRSPPSSGRADGGGAGAARSRRPWPRTGRWRPRPSRSAGSTGASRRCPGRRR